MIALWILVLMAACGDNGNDDTILTGFSGVIIFGIIAYVIYRYVRRKT